MRPNAIACTCPVCGAVFRRIPSRIKTDGAYCGRTCAAVARRTPLEQRIERDVDRSGDCHVWTGYIGDSGYPVLSVLVGAGYRPVPVARLVLEQKIGRPLKPGHCACHTCDNPPCVNPAHLWEGTRSDNIRDMHAKGRATPNRARGEQSAAAKLTEADVRAIRAAYAAGATQVQIGQRYGVGHRAISSVVNKQTWKHID